VIVSTRRPREIRRVARLLVLAVAFPVLAWAQPVPSAPGEPANVEVDPIRCWWRTSTGAVRSGAPFSLDLTCAVLENDAVRVVPDESRLGGNVIQMAPFEIVESSHPSDLYSGQRRFFQYHYVLRIISPDAIGKDVHLPDLVIQYRVNSRLPGNAALQGRDLVYMLPTQSIRILSMVPADAADVRDASGAPFSDAESLAFRARVLEILALTLVALGSLMVLLTLVRLARGARRIKPVGERVMSSRRLVRLAAGELSAVQRETERLGWDAARIERALAASRVAAAIAMGRRISQSAADSNAEPGEGRLVAQGVRGRGRRQTSWVSSSVTAEDLARENARSGSSADPGTRQTLERLQGALAAFGRSHYGQDPVIDRRDLDAALEDACEAARHLRAQHTWLREYFHRSSAGATEPQSQT
jgi:hypothetical protein